MKKRILLPALLLAAMACETEDENKDDVNNQPGTDTYVLNLQSNSPVTFGQSLSVAASEENADYSYQMTLPDGNTETTASFSANEARMSMAGWYFLEATKGSTVLRDSVEVSVAPAPIGCSPAANKLVGSSGEEMNFSSINGAISVFDQYEIEASATEGTLEIDLLHNFVPAGDRTYVIDNAARIDEDKAQVRMLYNGNVYTASNDQLVHLTKNGNQFEVVLCDVEMTSTQATITVDVQVSY